MQARQQPRTYEAALARSGWADDRKEVFALQDLEQPIGVVIATEKHIRLVRLERTQAGVRVAPRSDSAMRAVRRTAAAKQGEKAGKRFGRHAAAAVEHHEAVAAHAVVRLLSRRSVEQRTHVPRRVRASSLRAASTWACTQLGAAEP